MTIDKKPALPKSRLPAVAYRLAVCGRSHDQIGHNSRAEKLRLPNVPDATESVRRVAPALGVQDDEIALTRNATEAIHNLIRQYRGLTAGDAVLYADWAQTIGVPDAANTAPDLLFWSRRFKTGGGRV